MLELEDVNIRRGRRRLLSHISFSLHSGATALVGPNGAGKTTLMRSLIGLHREIEGDVAFRNLSIFSPEGRRELRRHVGYQPQLADERNSLSVRESVEYAAWLKAVTRVHMKSAVDTALERTGIEGLSRRTSSKLSGGESKRLLIAKAIVHEPSLLLLDEPSAALDPSERTTLLQLLQTLKTTTTILVSTHNTSDVASICDSVILIGRGRLLFNGRIEEFADAGESHSGLPYALDTAYAKLMADRE